MLLAHVQLENDAKGGVCLGRHSEKTFPAQSSSATRSRGYIYMHDLGVAHITLQDRLLMEAKEFSRTQ